MRCNRFGIDHVSTIVPAGNHLVQKLVGIRFVIQPPAVDVCQVKIGVDPGGRDGEGLPELLAGLLIFVVGDEDLAVEIEQFRVVGSRLHQRLEV